MGAPNAIDVRWIPSFAMMAYTNGIDNKFYFSQDGDPANISGPSGALSISDSKMSLAIAVRELESGEVIALKSDGGYAVNESDLPPAQWNAPRRWNKFGPPCAPAIGVGYDFLAFPAAMEEGGAYLYKSGAAIEHISKEYQTTWNRVNWAASSTFYTEVDDKAHRVHFGVALDLATQVSHELVCSYEAGWEFPEVLNSASSLSLHARTRCKEYDQVLGEMTAEIEELERRHPGAEVAGPFRRGYERRSRLLSAAVCVNLG